MDVPAALAANVPAIKRFTGGGTVIVDRDTVFASLIVQVGGSCQHGGRVCGWVGAHVRACARACTCVLNRGGGHKCTRCKHALHASGSTSAYGDMQHADAYMLRASQVHADCEPMCLACGPCMPYMHH